MNQENGRKGSGQIILALLPDITLLIRLAISVILLIAAYRLNVSSLISVLIMIAAALIAGTDILISAVRAVSDGAYFDTSCLVSVAAIAAFDAGCFAESVVFLIIFQVFSSLHKNLLKLTKDMCLGFIPTESDSVFSGLRNDIKRSDALEEATESFEHKVYTADKVLSLIAMLFAIVMPLLTDMTYVMSVRRGAMLLAAAVPVSVLPLFSLCRKFGVSFVAAFGVYLKDPEVFNKAKDVKTLVFDKTDVISGGVLKIAAVSSPLLNKDSFLRILAHSVYNSEQRIAKPLLSAYNGEIRPELISGFTDLPGKGVELSISGKSILFGTKELFDIRGIGISEGDIRSGYVMYLAVSGKYAGSVVFSESLNPYAEQAISELARMRIGSILLSEDGADICEKTADQIGVDKFFAGCDAAKKMSVLKELKAGCDDGEGLLYVSAESVGYHTDADIDALVGNASDCEDIIMSNIGIFGLPALIRTADAVSLKNRQNTFIMAAVKLLLIVLALTGWSTLWFVALLDFAVGMLCILNILRISHYIE